MADGSHRAIESIHEGEIVRSYDDAHSRWVSAPVLRTLVHPPEAGTGQFIIVNGSLRLTSNHPLSVGGHPKRADLLEIGDPIVVMSPRGEPERTTVWSLETVNRREVTYDLEVASPGRFVAGNMVVELKIQP
jgi:hypothetical protein